MTETLTAPADTMDEFNCLDCHRNTSQMNEYYMVQFHLWHEFVPEHNGMLCIGCLERRMGRELVGKDFTDAPINEYEHPIFRQSERLRSRLSR